MNSFDKICILWCRNILRSSSDLKQEERYYIGYVMIGGSFLTGFMYTLLVGFWFLLNLLVSRSHSRSVFSSCSLLLKPPQKGGNMGARSAFFYGF